MAKKPGKAEILAKFFDDGAYSALFADGAVSAAFGCANGQPVYAVAQNGEAVSVKDLQKNCKVLDLAAQTGNPVVTFYDSVGAKLEEGAELLAAFAQLNEKIAKLSGVVPQVAVVTGVCAASSAVCAASADVCIVAEGAELSFTAPFTSAAAGDKVADAGSAQFAAKAGVAAVVAADALDAAAMAAHVVGLLPGNNLAAPSVFEFEAPTEALNLAKYEPAKAVAAILDKDSSIELFGGFGKKAVVALGTINGNAVGVVAPGNEICHNCASKMARFVRLCDAFSVPVVTLVNTQGFKASSSDDLAGGVREAARLAATYADATTAKVAVLAGKAMGPVYMALANADMKIAVNGATICPVDPAVAVSVLCKEELDAADNIQAAVNAKAAAYAKDFGAAAAVANGLADVASDAASVRANVIFALDMLATKRAVRMAKKHGNMAL